MEVGLEGQRRNTTLIVTRAASLPLGLCDGNLDYTLLLIVCRVNFGKCL